MSRAQLTSTVEQNSGGAVAPYVAGKNGVINGGMDVWQRGTSFTSGTRAYTADRFEFFRQSSVAGATLSRQSSGLTGIQYCARVSRDSGNTATNILWLTYSLETANSFSYAGKTIAFSFYARAGANFSAASNILNFSVQSGTGTDQNLNAGYTGAADVIASTNVTLTTSWQRFTYTGTVGSTATELGYYFDYTPVGTAGAADYYEITGIQIEVGSVATPFARAGGTLQGELAACQRYYWRFTGSTGVTEYTGLYVYAISTTTCTLPNLIFGGNMRITPTSVDYSNLGVYTTATQKSGTWALFDTAYNHITPDLRYTHGSAVFTAATWYQLVTDSAGYLGLSAEL
jgi:hypothetical protein